MDKSIHFTRWEKNWIRKSKGDTLHARYGVPCATFHENAKWNQEVYWAR